MRGTYSNPLKVYLIVGAIALIGFFSGSQLPISLYPNSNKPTIRTSVNYGKLNSEEFIKKYGGRIEGQLKAISTGALQIEKLTSEYHNSSVNYGVEFKWGAQPKEAIKEVQQVMNGLSASWPKEVRDSLSINFWAKSSGFIALSFYSDLRSTEELYKILEPVIVPKLSSVKDAENPGLWNPGSEEITIMVKPDVATALGIFPRHIEQAVRLGVNGTIGGSVNAGNSKLIVQMPRTLDGLKSLEQLLIKTPTGRLVHLSEVATIDKAKASESNNIMKTSGMKSLILFSKPKTGGNVKKMAEDILNIVDKAMLTLPKDIHYRSLVDPSEFIRASVNNVIHEVGLAAILTVLVLFIFLGSLKNTVTAAIEIPLSMVMAFIMMKLSGMNLNLISLGGLALAAGMNVDASVVTMENIFRNFERNSGPFDFGTRLKIIIRSVKEVALPIVASTLSTLVVFAPLAFTSDLTNAVLGDLAKAVVFSHACSMFIALILVPTIRLQLMGKGIRKTIIPISPIQKQLSWLETKYSKSLRFFIESISLRSIAAVLIVISLGVLSFFVIPNMKREIIGTPDTDWMILSVNTSGNTLVKQMEAKSDEIENDFLKKFGKDIKYTFVQIRSANNTTIMARLKNKEDMDRVWKAMEENYENEPGLYYWVGPWNPAELPIPNPPQMRIVVRGSNVEDRTLYAKALYDELQEQEVFPRLWTEPGTKRKEEIILVPHLDQWPALQKSGANFSPQDLTDLTRTMTDGKSLESISVDGDNFPVVLKYPSNSLNNKEDLESTPIKVGEKFVALKALADVNLKEARPRTYREDGRNLIVIEGKQTKGKKHLSKASLIKAKEVVGKFEKKNLEELGLAGIKKPTIYFENAEKDLSDALNQLVIALVLSLCLIFFTMLLQFGSLIQTMIIMSAIPLALIGGLTGLWVFKSSLSLNSALGIILLNGIAVNNSIILVDFIRKAYEDGMVPIEAAILAAKRRLRPILITSLTTILGMLPIALGTGEGGKILQPLGIAVAGGLWFSTLCTIFVVPTLEVIYLNWKMKRDDRPGSIHNEIDTNESVLIKEKIIKDQDEGVSIQ